MSEYEVPVTGGVSDYTVPLHGHLETVIREYPVIPNPEGEPTEDITSMEIDHVIYRVKDPGVHDWARAEQKPSYTKAEVGLGNVDNTADLDKPVSTATQEALQGLASATQTALNGKVDNSTLNNYYTATQTDNLLNGKVNKDGNKVLSDNNYSDEDKAIVDGVTSALANKVDKEDGKGLSENNFTNTLKSKLDGIEAEANKTIVDNALNGTSANPVENRVVKSALDEKLNADETAVNSNGLVIATPVTDNAPYIYRQTPVKESFKALMKKIVGASVVWNQLQDGVSSTVTQEGVKFTSINNGKSYQLSGTSEANTTRRFNNNASFGITSGHKYYVKAYTQNVTGISTVIYQNDWSSSLGTKGLSGAVVEATTTSSNARFCVQIANNTNTNDIILTPQLFDLTAMFGTTIADYVYTLETAEAGSGIAWLQSYGFFTEDYYAYKQNKLESGCVSAHKTYDGETLLTNTELSPITLRGLFKLSTDKLTVDGDEYNADGSVNRNIGSLILSDYVWRADENVEGLWAAEITPIRVKPTNFLCANYHYNNVSTSLFNTGDGKFLQTSNRCYLYLCNKNYSTAEEFTTSVNGLEMLYLLATPTTEESTPFTETEIVGSTEEFIDYEVAQSNRDVAIPVGTDTDYYQEMKLPPLPTTSGNHNLIYNVETGFGWS